jgi:hypothetical protein
MKSKPVPLSHMAGAQIKGASTLAKAGGSSLSQTSTMPSSIEETRMKKRIDAMMN